MAIGDIGSVIATKEWRSGDIYLPFLSHATGTIYLIFEAVNRTVRSVSIDGAGNIGAEIDSLLLGAVGGPPRGAVHISGDVYAIAFLASTQVVVKTFTCDSSGNLDDTGMDTINLAAKPANNGFYAHIIPSHKPNIYIVAYTDSADDGWLATITINDDGSIDEPVLHTWEIQPAQGRYPWLINISNNLFAVIISEATSNRSQITTFTVSDTGVMSSIQAYLFDGNTNSGNGGIILHVSGDVYAIFWQGAALDGWIYTLSINGAGAISANIDTWEFVTTYGHNPQAYLASENQAGNGQVFVVVHSQNGVDGPQVFTVEILNNGTISKSFIGELTLVAADYAHDLSIVRPGRGIYAACFEDFTGGNSGKIKTFDVEEALALSSVTTDPAAVLGAIAATLNGTLDEDGGEVCECGFEWGLDTSYGHFTSTESKAKGQTFSQIIGGLQPGTTYHFRAFATNSVGTSYGADRSFTTDIVISRAYALAREEL